MKSTWFSLPERQWKIILNAFFLVAFINRRFWGYIRLRIISHMQLYSLF